MKAQPHDPISGPMPREVFDALIEAPYGKAAATIRQYDPMFGRKEGETIKWRVEMTRNVTQIGFVTVEAVSAEDAMALAEDTPSSDVDWDFDDADLPDVVEAKAQS